MKTLFSLLALASLLFGVACGWNGGGAIPPPPPVGNFSNASLSGQYAFNLSGLDTNGTFREAGVFAADGAGHITSATDDFSQGNAGIVTTSVTGSYGINPDGTGDMVLNFPLGGSISLRITLVNSSKLYLIQKDTFANAAGLAEKQNSAAFTAPPSGVFVFRFHGASVAQGSSGAVGSLTVSGGSFTGSEDLNRGGLFNPQLSVSGSFTTPDGAGRGAATFTDGLGSTYHFIYYVVDANNLRFLNSDAGILMLGRAEKQSGGPFSAASLSGSFAFGSQGDTNAWSGGVQSVGRFTAAGNGAINSGAYDFVQDGASFSNISFSGSYTMNSVGRAVVTLNPSTGGAVQETFYLVSPSRAFFLINDPNKVEDGTLDLQTVSSFSNATLSGQFAFVMNGFDTTDFVGRIGTFTPDGSGNLSLTYLLNRYDPVAKFATITPNVFLTGAYAVGSNGRTVAAASTLSNNLVFYLISGNDAYILQNDPNTQITGVAGKQP